MAREVRFSITEGPHFLEQMSLEVEDDGSIILAAYKNNREVYAFARISPEHFRSAVSLLLDTESDATQREKER